MRRTTNHLWQHSVEMFLGVLLGTIALFLALPQVEAHASTDPPLDIPGNVMLVSNVVQHGVGTPHYIVDFETDFAYSDGGIMVVFDNSLVLAFPPRYMARERCWTDDGTYIHGCSRMVYDAYQWKRLQVREITVDWQPCRYDEVTSANDPCVWDARHQGNGTGRSFKVDRGTVTYISHARAEWLLS